MFPYYHHAGTHLSVWVHRLCSGRYQLDMSGLCFNCVLISICCSADRETGLQWWDMKGSWNSGGYILDFPLPLDGWVALWILVRDCFYLKIKNCEVVQKGCKGVPWSYILKAEHSSDSSQIMSACQPGFGRHVTSHALANCGHSPGGRYWTWQSL